MKRTLSILFVTALLLTCIPLGAVSAASVVDQIYVFLKNEIGLNSAAACGVLANIEAESSFNPNLYGDSGSSYGICQWNGVRFTALRNWCSANGYDYTTLTGQLNYLKKELSANDSNYLWNGRTVYNLISSVENTSQGAYNAAYDWCYHYERPSDKEIRSIYRGNLALSKYWPLYGDGPNVEVTQLTASGVNYPINKQSGQAFQVFGTITSPNYLEWVHCFVTDTAGNWIFCGTYGDTPAEQERKIKTYNINLIDGKMTFSDLANGTYIYYVQALDDKGYFVSIEKTFTVTASSTTVGTASQTCVHEHTINRNYTWGSWVTEKAATCTAKGLKSRTCYCGAKESKTIKATGHTFNKAVSSDKYLKSAATCTTAAVYYLSCKCGEKGTETFTSGGNVHTYKSACDEVCDICGFTRENGNKHLYSTLVMQEPTCTATGKKKNICIRCGESNVVITPVSEHSYDAATCTNPKICKVCGDTTGKALGHKYTNTCDTSCNTCKATRKITHSYKTVTKKATATANGYTVKRCSVCKKETGKTTIYKASKISLSKTTYTYNGKIQKPTVTIKDSKGNKISSSNYTITYASGRKNVGTYKVTVKFKGKYSGTKILTFKINPAKTTVKSLTAGKKSLKVAITKKSTQVTGYQIQYSTSKFFKSYKTKTLTSYKKTSLTLSGLSAKKTYYVRVRTYKTVNGVKYYSGWSTIKYKKTK